MRVEARARAGLMAVTRQKMRWARLAGMLVGSEPAGLRAVCIVRGMESRTTPDHTCFY